MDILKKEISGISGLVRIITTKAGTQEILRKVEHKNLVVSGTNTGRNLIAQKLAGDNTYSLNITHADIGTGSATPANSDTVLETATVRTALTIGEATGNGASLRFFFSDALLPDGSYTEFGTFVDGSGTIDTGQLFNRALFGSAYEKAAGEDTTVEVDFTINSA